MFDRLRKDEEGFTLIELLVVVIIIGILAAIAIPTFLNQREGAWRSTVESDLRNIATNMETYYAEHDAYPAGSALATAATITVTDGTNPETYPKSDNVGLTVTQPSANDASAGGSFCVTGTHANLAGETFYYDSVGGGISEVAC